MMKHLLLYLLLFGLVSCSVKTDNDLSKIRLKELNDRQIDLTQYRGKTVFINFWATWCKPCIQEMPTIAHAMDSLKNDNIVFLFASNEEVSEIEKFKKKRPYDFQYVRLENMEALGITALPTTFVYNPQGKLEFSEAGFRSWDAPENIELIKNIMNHHDK